MSEKYDFQNAEGLDYLQEVLSDTVDLVLTDPPYITSRDTGMDKWKDHVENLSKTGANAKTEEQWGEFKSKKNWASILEKNNIKPEDVEKTFEKMKKEYIKYGSIYGKKYAVKTDYGKWDSEFTMDTLDAFVRQFYRVLRPGGTAIIFFDLWKITPLKDMMESAGFKQLRMIEWIKTNPQPLNSSRNYLTNCREIALLGVKKSKPTFNSKYDNALYHYPIASKDRFHPTQKSLPLFEDLVKKHSNEGGMVLDPFAGSATTGVAALASGRNFKGCELDEDFFKKAQERLDKILK